MTTKADKIEEELAVEVARAEQLASGEISSSTDLVHVDRSAPIAKREMLRKKQEIERTKQRVQGLQKALREELERQMHEKLELAREVIGPLEKQIKEIEEGIWMVNLYMGQKEEIKRLRKGKPALAGTPITIRQMVLGMDEESAVNAENAGISYHEVEKFDEWVREKKAHVDQVLPEQKGVVAICPRMADTKIFEGMSMQEAITAMREDKHTYFLIRNGNNVYRLWTDFSVGQRMVPKPDEFAEVFKQKSGFRMRWEDEDDEWDDDEIQKAEERLAAHQRHYLRVGLILQGLADRTPVFHPLPEGGVTFTSNQSYDEGKIQFVMDAETSLGTGREPFYHWLSRLNSELRPGMRIIGQFSGYGGGFANANECTQEYGDNGHSRLRPKTASHPESMVPHTIESRKQDGGLVFKYKRTDQWWGWGPHPDKPGWKLRTYHDYKNKASCTVYPQDRFILPLDFVTVEEMEEYLHARTERHAYIDMFPLLHKAIAIKKQEAEEEAPFVELLTGKVAEANEISNEEATEMVPALVWWWKVKNKQHYALIGEDEARALKQIVEESVKRRKLDKKHTPPELLSKLMNDYPDALVVARRSDGKHVVLLPMDPEESVYVRIIVFKKNGEIIEDEEWKEVPRTISSSRIFFEGKRWKEWNRGATYGEFPTGPEKEDFIRQHKTAKVVAITYDEDNRLFEVWKIIHRNIPPEPKIEIHPEERHWECIQYEWSRDQSRKIRFDKHTERWSSGRYIGKRPWRPDERSQYGESRGLLYENEEIFAKAQEQDERIQEVVEESEPLERAFNYGCDQFLEKLSQVYENQAFKEFMDEYGDASLWEGYRESQKMEFSPRYWKPRRDLAFIATLIERGVKVNGVKLKTLAKKAGVKLHEDYDSDWVFDTAGREKETNKEAEEREERERRVEEKRFEAEEKAEEKLEREEEEEGDYDEIEIDGEVVKGDFSEEDDTRQLEESND